MDTKRIIILIAVIGVAILGYFGYSTYSLQKQVVALNKQVATLTDEASSTTAILIPLNTLGHQIMNTANAGSMASSTDFISALYVGFNQISQELQAHQAGAPALNTH